MSAPKFTPGPWAVFDTHPEKACFYIDSADQSPEHALGEVAVIYTTTNPVRRANAALIAAAPDLFAFARSMDETPPACAVQTGRPAGHSDPYGDCDCWACEMVRTARAALAKAEGR